ncbi:MAG TPA: hypothetical protein DDZ80_02440 [Cyanobacteria bacterium UBA8803]|nr:hypothetical protein [Cyanobacteria bacterium UBA9273]HBL57441.1 hypothetical protein [Cyanobacteria bacterium UBA8803]
MGYRRDRVQKKSPHSSTFTPSNKPLAIRRFANGVQARSAELPTTDILQTRPFAPKVQPQQEMPDLQTRLERAERFGYNAANIPLFAPSTPPPSVQQSPLSPQQLPQYTLTETSLDKTITQKEKNVIQRQEISPEEAEREMQKVGGGFRSKPYKIIKPWGNQPESNTNCHGYTIHGEVGHFERASGLLPGISADANVAVFTSTNEIWHSGRYENNQLRHFLIGVGIVESTLNLTDTAGYHARYNLPDQRRALEDFLNPSLRSAVADARRDLVEAILGYASDKEINLDEFELTSTYEDWQDMEEQQKNEFINENREKIRQLRDFLIKDKDIPESSMELTYASVDLLNP